MCVCVCINILYDIYIYVCVCTYIMYIYILYRYLLGRDLGWRRVDVRCTFLSVIDLLLLRDETVERPCLSVGLWLMIDSGTFSCDARLRRIERRKCRSRLCLRARTEKGEEPRVYGKLRSIMQKPHSALKHNHTRARD